MIFLSKVSQNSMSKTKKDKYSEGGKITEAGDTDFPSELLNYAKGGINKRRLKKGDTVYVAGKRHTNKSLGNTYHTVRVYVNDRLIGKTESPVYGYENSYLDTGRKILFEKYNKPYGFEIDSPLWKLKDKNVKFLYSVKDYNTRKELY